MSMSSSLLTTAMSQALMDVNTLEEQLSIKDPKTVVDVPRDLATPPPTTATSASASGRSSAATSSSPEPPFTHEAGEEDDDSKLYSLAAALVSIANSPVQVHPPGANNFIQAYAKIEGPEWTFFMQKPSCLLGRAPTPQTAYQQPSSPIVEHNSTADGLESSADFYLGSDPLVFAERHLMIRYISERAQWELVCMTREALSVDGVHVPPFGTALLHLGSVVRIGASCSFRFILPGPEELGSRPTTPQSSDADNATSSTAASAWNPCEVGRKSRRGGTRRPKENPEPKSDSAVHGNGNNGELTKPSQSYACLIAEAISSVSEKRLTLSGIYQYLAEHYPYFRQTKNGWQNSVRHNLSLNKAFKKVPRDIGEQGKGMFWVVDQDFEHLVKGSSGRRTASRARAPSPGQSTDPAASVPANLPPTARIFHNVPMMQFKGGFPPSGRHPMALSLPSQHGHPILPKPLLGGPTLHPFSSSTTPLSPSPSIALPPSIDYTSPNGQGRTAAIQTTLPLSSWSPPTNNPPL
jgi:hypothetical protein